MTDDDAPTRQRTHTPAAAASVQAPAQGSTDGLAVAAMVIGIVALLFCWIPFLNIVLAILAIVFGIVGLVRGISKGMAIAGLALGGVSFILIVVFFIGVIVAAMNGTKNVSGVTLGL